MPRIKRSHFKVPFLVYEHGEAIKAIKWIEPCQLLLVIFRSLVFWGAGSLSEVSKLRIIKVTLSDQYVLNYALFVKIHGCKCVNALLLINKDLTHAWRTLQSPLFPNWICPGLRNKGKFQWVLPNLDLMLPLKRDTLVCWRFIVASPGLNILELWGTLGSGNNSLSWS